MLELGVVVIILAVLALSVGPAFTGSLERARFVQTVRAVSNLAVSASRMASAQNRALKLQYDGAGRVISLAADSEDVDLSAAGGPVVLSEDCELTAMEVASRTPQEEKSVEVCFYPDGRSDGAWLVFTHVSGRTLTVVINAVTAEPSIAQGERGPEEWMDLENQRTSRSLFAVTVKRPQK